MAVVPKGSDQAEFLFAFGHFIILWNHVELVARDILVWLTGGNVAAQILSQQTGNASLTDSIRVSSAWHPDAAAHLVHFAKLMDTVRPYRNYYVHNLIGVLPEAETKEMIGVVMSLNVKGKYALYEKALRVAELDEISSFTDETREYGLKIHHILKSEIDMASRIAPFASLEKSTLPKTLVKSVRDPQAQIYQPQSSLV